METVGEQYLQRSHHELAIASMILEWFHSNLGTPLYPLQNGIHSMARTTSVKFGELVSNMEIGDQFTDPGYSSTSLDLRSAINFDSDELTLLLITLDTNCKWTYIDAFRDIYCKGKWVHQFEVLLNKNTTFTVTKKERRKQVIMFKDAIDCGTPILSNQWIRAIHVTASRKF